VSTVLLPSQCEQKIDGNIQGQENAVGIVIRVNRRRCSGPTKTFSKTKRPDRITSISQRPSSQAALLAGLSNGAMAATFSQTWISDSPIFSPDRPTSIRGVPAASTVYGRLSNSYKKRDRDALQLTEPSPRAVHSLVRVICLLIFLVYIKPSSLSLRSHGNNRFLFDPTSSCVQET